MISFLSIYFLSSGLCLRWRMRIAFLGFGEVAVAFSSALGARGCEITAYDILLDNPGGVEKLAARAGPARVTFVALRDAIRDADYVFSTVTTSVALDAARRCAACLQPAQSFVDLNATEPQLKAEIGAVIEAGGARFVEGALLGAVGVTGAKTEILLGGPHARAAERDLAGTMGLNARFYSEEIGRASTFKMLRSVFSKGMEALLIEFLVAGERAGIREDLWTEVTTLFATQPFDKVALNWVRTHSGAHRRRADEMKQVVAVLRGLGIEPVVTSATQALFERSGALGLGPLPSADDVIRFLDEKT
jgi:3-hydroxyisobutyrate dehydrogenase-like beta-hydroxyacid dehydrogenase